MLILGAGRDADYVANRIAAQALWQQGSRAG
jgi:hypothetical protein